MARWRRFLPHKAWSVRGSLNDTAVIGPDSLYGAARRLADQLIREARSKKNDTPSKQITMAMKLLQDRGIGSKIERLAALLLLSPQTARAQDDLDKHRGGYANRQARVFELIDFNDSFVDLVIILSDAERKEFVSLFWNELKRFSEIHHTPHLTHEQYDAIVHGLSREIAVYFGAHEQGLKARMTSRVQDARGIDMIITDPRSNRSIEIDCKTRSSFHFRLIDLERKHRIEEEERLRCELQGFCKVTGGSRMAESHSLLVRIATKDLGEIVDFKFQDTGKLGELLRTALTRHGVVIVDG